MWVLEHYTYYICSKMYLASVLYYHRHLQYLITSYRCRSISVNDHTYKKRVWKSHLNIQCNIITIIIIVPSLGPYTTYTTYTTIIIMMMKIARVDLDGFCDSANKIKTVRAGSLLLYRFGYIEWKIDFVAQKYTAFNLTCVIPCDHKSILAIWCDAAAAYSSLLDLILFLGLYA